MTISKLTWICICFLNVMMMSSFVTEIDEPTVLGSWILEETNGDIWKFGKADKLANRKPGIEFLNNNKLVRRQNAGWCATPPISYANYDGTWNFTSDKTIAIKHKFWGGNQTMEFKILELSDDILTVEVINFNIIKDE